MPKKSRFSTIWHTCIVIIVMFSMLIVQAFFSVNTNPDDVISYMRENSVNVAEALPTYSEEQLHGFTSTELFDLFIEHSETLLHHMPELQIAMMDFQGLGIFTILQVALFAFWWSRERKRIHDLVPFHPSRRTWLLIIGTVLGISLTTTAIASLARLFGYQGIRDDLQLIRNGSFFLFLLLALVGAPISEECITRGLLFSRLRSWMPLRTAMVIQALVFGLLHGEIINMTMAVVLGYFFAELSLRTGGLRAPIIAHLAANSLPIMLLFPLLAILSAVEYISSGMNDAELFFSSYNPNLGFLLFFTLPLAIYCWRRLNQVLPPLPDLRARTTPYTPPCPEVIDELAPELATSPKSLL